MNESIDPETQSRAIETPCAAEPERWFPHREEDQQAAAVICWAQCPIREACLDLANRLEQGSEVHRHGVWGGYTAKERVAHHKTALRRSRAGAQA